MISTISPIRFSVKSAIAFLIGAIVGVVAIQFVPVHVDVQMRTKQKGFLQYYFDTGAGFNEAQSKRIPLSVSPEFSHYAISIRAANGFCAFRIDPLETRGQFEIIGFQIDYLFWHRQWHGHGELKYLVPVHEIEVISTEGEMLSGQATGNDPRLVITDVEYLKHWQLIATIFCTMLGGTTAFLFLVVMRHFGGFKTVLASEHTPLFIIVTIAALLRIIYWWQSGLPSEPNLLQTMWPDEGTYFSMAQYIMTHGLREYFLAEQSVMTVPGNPIYIALIYTVIHSVNVIRAVNLLLSILNIVFIYKLGKRKFSKPVGLLAAGICAVHGQLIQYSATLLTEPLFLYLFIAGIYYLVLTLETVNLPRHRFYRYVIASAFFLTIATLTRSIAMLLPVFLLASIGFREAYSSWQVGKPAYPWLKRSALPLLIPVLIVGIVATKNYAFFDRFMVATGSGAALWLGSRADTEGDEPPYRGRTYDTQVITHGASHLSIQGDMLLMEAAKKNIRENPLGYAWWSVKKVGRLVVGSNLAWFYPHKNITDWYCASGRNAVSAANMVFQIILASTIAVYGIIGLVAARGQESFSLITTASVCYLIIFSVPFLVTQRYGLPLVMLLVIPASAIMYGAWQAVGRMRRVALFGVPFALAIVLQILFLG
ncbi:MAG: glycosyltransferase family 39 protein [Deltaproteobacteria bacterium]|nr:glycosyltransferase family 39 protein [Deltaproteobacteria bacterium]